MSGRRRRGVVAPCKPFDSPGNNAYGSGRADAIRCLAVQYSPGDAVIGATRNLTAPSFPNGGISWQGVGYSGSLDLEVAYLAITGP